MIVGAAVLLLVLSGLFLLRARRHKDYNGDQEAWSRAIAMQSSSAQRLLLEMSRRFANFPTIYESGTSPQYAYLTDRLLAAGGMYGSSVEVFLSFEALCITASLVLLSIVWMIHMFILFKLLAVLFVVLFVVWPWDNVNRKAKEHARAVTASLPEFAELLQMPLLTAGIGVLGSLRFTAERLSGPVSDEVKNLLVVLDSHAMDEVQAFQLAGARLGTPEAKAFMTALMTAHVEGDKVVRTIVAQAENLRIKAHNDQRALNRQLPIRLVIIMGVHLLPVLFAVLLYPAFVSFSTIGKA